MLPVSDSEPTVEECFYCGALLSKGNREDDHMPIPQHLGGVTTVPSCRTCHDMKDRYKLGDWTVEWFVAAFGPLNREGRILVAKAVAVAAEASDIIRKSRAACVSTGAHVSIDTQGAQ